MRIGAYLGNWQLDGLGGMGVYLRDLLAAAIEQKNGAHELIALVDRANLASASALAPRIPTLILDRPQFSEIPPYEQRGVVKIRRLSYHDLDEADAQRSSTWSGAADAYLWGLDRAVESSGIDALYFTIPPYVKRPRVPFVLTIHDLKHLHRPQDHDRGDLARRRRWGRVARGAALVYSSYEHVREDIVRSLHVPRGRTAVVPLATPSDLGSGAPPGQTCSIATPDRFVLMPAQFWPHKNHVRAIQAIAMLRDRGINVTLVCTGQTQGQCGKHAGQMQRLARSLGVDHLVRQVGHVDRATLVELYRRAEIILVATLYDPGSFPAMEALALGKPLIASRVTSIPETVGDAALLFDPHDVHQLTGAIERLWNDEMLRARLGRAGPGRITNRTWGQVASDWLRLFERLPTTPSSDSHTIHSRQEVPA
jgi:glycosyltransferase involved in cell wall biosynthesis